MNIKYLSDGRKVAIIGKLNNQEMIVQEIFVDDKGNEIPSGEPFTAKSLHDTPVKSWKQMEEERAEKRLNAIKEEIEKDEEKIKDIYIKLSGYKDALEATSKFVQLLEEKDLKIMTAFVTGTIKYIVYSEYGIKEPVNMMDEIIRTDWYYNNRYEGIKLVSVLGNSKGNFEYRIHQYGDSSGSSRKVYPFTNYEDAKNFIKEKAIDRINKETLSIEEYKICKKMGIEFEKEIEEKFKSQIIKDKGKCINDKKDTIKKLEIEITEKEKQIQNIKQGKL